MDRKEEETWSDTDAMNTMDRRWEQLEISQENRNFKEIYISNQIEIVEISGTYE